MHNDEKYMKRVFELAAKGWGGTNPNPLVGAVITKDDKLISEGYHKLLGEAHAEVDAISNAKEAVSGSTMYVNLEPCSHYGRTPPCVKAIIEANIKKVVIGMEDPNPKVSGKGISILREAGIDVVVGVLEQEAKKLNEIFIKYITKKMPFVILKTAMTLDGKISSSTGSSKWITGDKSREYVHTIRDRVSSIMVGSNTIILDNPSLTTRIAGKDGSNPCRIIVDSEGIVPIDSKAIDNDSRTLVILATTTRIKKEKEEMFKQKGVKVLKLDAENGKVDLKSLIYKLYEMEIDSVLLEGGGTLNASFLEAGLVDKVMFFIAPKLIGGKDAITPFEGIGIENMSDAIKLKDISVSKFDDDILIEGYI